MTSNPTPLPAGLARHKQLLPVALAGAVAAVEVSVLGWLGAGSVSAQGSDTTFSPSVTITVPQTDTDGDGVKDFAGASFVVEFDAMENSNSGCTDSATGTYVVQDGGAVTASNGAPVLVDRPAGVTSNCSYDVIFPEYIEPEPGATLAEDREALYLRPSVAAAVRGTPVARRSVSATFDATHGHSGELTSFDPNVTASVPDIDDSDGNSEFDEDRIWLSYSSDMQGCHKKVFEKYSVDEEGDVTAVGSVVRLDIRPGGVAAGELCDYDVDFVISSNDLLGFPSSASRPEIDGDDSEEEIVLVVVFSPELSFSVPLTDSNSDGMVDYAGTRVTATYGRADGSPVGCPGGIVESYVVESDGTVGFLNPGQRIALPKYPADRVTGRFCFFSLALSIQYRDGISESHGSLIASPSEPLHKITFRYRSASFRFDTKFEVNVNIQVPNVDANGDEVNDFSGHDIVVRLTHVSGPAVGCTKPVNWIFRIQNDGEVVIAPGTVIALADKFASVSSRCSYQLTFPEYIEPKPGATKFDDIEPLYARLNTIKPVNSSNISSSSLETSSNYASVSYSAAHDYVESDSFIPLVNVFVPAVILNGANEFSGERFWLSYRSYTPGCDKIVFEKFSVEGNGNVSFVGTRVKLDSRPQGAASGVLCEYYVDFFVSSSDSLGLRSGTGLLQINSGNTEAVQVALWFAYFPEISLFVPLTDIDNDGVVDYSGTNIRITYGRGERSATGCPDSIFENYIVEAGGTVVLPRPYQRAMLPKYPENRTTGSFCTYLPDLTLNYGDGIPAEPDISYILRASSIPQISIESRSATIRLNSVLPINATATIPEVDDDGDGISDLSGVKAYFHISRRAGSHRDCRGIRGQYFHVQDDGTYRLGEFNRNIIKYAHGFPDLLHRIGGSTAQCLYDIEFRPVTYPWRGYSGNSLFLLDAESILLGPDEAASARYGSLFTPLVTLSVPQIDADADGSNDFVGKIIRIKYDSTETDIARKEDCKALTRQSYIIGSDGRVKRKDGHSRLRDAIPYKTPTSTPTNSSRVLTTRCSFNIAFLDSTGSFEFQDDTVHEVQHDSGDISVKVKAVFTPPVVVRQLASAQINDGVGSFSVTYRRATGANSGCTESATETYNVAVDGTVALEGERVKLIGGLAGESFVCSYNVEIPSSTSLGGLKLPDGNRGSFDMFTSEFSADYFTEFRSNISVSVPEGSYGDDGFVITVVYTNKPGSADSCTMPDSEAFSVAADGTVTPPVSRLKLVDRVGGVSGVCSYSATFVETSDAVEPKGSTTIDYSSESTVSPFIYVSKFSPAVTISVPNVTDDDGGKLFSGVVFTVSFSMVSDSVDSCTDLASEVHNVNNDGNIVPPVAGAKASLIDRIGGVADACLYDVSISANKKGANLETGDIMAVSSGDKVRTVVYKSMFLPDLDISVPNVTGTNGNNMFHNVEFTVNYTKVANSDTECSDDVEETYNVKKKGAVKLLNADSRTKFLGHTSDGMHTCSYDVRIASSNDSLRRQGSRIIAVKATDKQRSVSFATEFVSPLRFSVPLVDGDGNGIKDFSGVLFTVSYVKPLASEPGCTAPATEIYEVGPNGTVELSASSTPVNFVDYPAGGSAEVQCRYNATITSSLDVLKPQDGVVIPFDADDSEIPVRYATEFQASSTVAVSGLSTFEMTLHLRTRFTVGFEPSEASEPFENCSEGVEKTYEIQANDDGSVHIPVGELWLVDYPAGGTERCSYKVVVSRTSDPRSLGLHVDTPVPDIAEDGTLTLKRVLNRDNPSVTITYSKIVYFPLTGTIDVYTLDANSNGQHDLAGRKISIKVEPAEGASYMCVKGKLEYSIQQDGSVMPTGSADSFVKELPGSNILCKYNLVFDSSADLVWQPDGSNEEPTVNFDDDEFSATFTDGFPPDVNILVPDIEDSGGNVFRDTEFRVTFAQSSNNKDASCSPSLKNVIYTVNSSGNATTDREIIFVDYTWVKSSGVLARGATCSYTATFELDAEEEESDGDYGFLKLATSATVPFSASSPRLEVSFDSYFVPNLSFSVPDLNDSDGNHRYSGAVFEVRFSRDIGASDGCVDSENRANIPGQRYVLQDSGSVEPESELISLKDGTAESATRCSYRAILPPSATGLRSLSLALESARFSSFTGKEEVDTEYSAKFTPGITIELQPGSRPETDFAYTIYDVVLTRESESYERCSPSERLSYSVEASGRVVEDIAPDMIYAKFVGFELCNYTATISINSGIRMTQEPATVTISIDSPSPRVVFTAAPPG